MSQESLQKIFNTTNCISEQLMFDYINNRLSAKEQHLVEKHLLNCEFCSDALEGLMLIKNKGLIQETKELVLEKIKKAAEKQTRIVSLFSKRVIAFAASLIILISSIWFVKYVFDKKDENKMAENNSVNQTEFVKENISEKQEKLQQDFSNLKLDETDASKQIQTKNTNKEKLSGLKNANTVLDNGKDRATSNGTTSAANGGLAINDISVLESKEVTLDEEKNAKLGDKILAIAAAPVTAERNSIVKSEETTKRQDVNEKSRSEERYETKSPSQNQEIALMQMQNSNADKTNYDANKNISISDSVLSVAEQMPEFIGGNDSLNAFIKQNINHSIVIENITTESTIYVKCLIDETGRVLNPKIVKGVNQKLDNEIIRVIKLFPLWKPAIQKGKQVKVFYTVPFKLDLK